MRRLPHRMDYQDASDASLPRAPSMYVLTSWPRQVAYPHSGGGPRAERPSVARVATRIAVEQQARKGAYARGVNSDKESYLVRQLSPIFDWSDDPSRVSVRLSVMGEAKTRVAIVHEGMADASSADQRKAYWRKRLTALKALLEN